MIIGSTTCLTMLTKPQYCSWLHSPPTDWTCACIPRDLSSVFQGMSCSSIVTFVSVLPIVFHSLKRGKGFALIWVNGYLTFEKPLIELVYISLEFSYHSSCLMQLSCNCRVVSIIAIISMECLVSKCQQCRCRTIRAKATAPCGSLTSDSEAISSYVWIQQLGDADIPSVLSSGLGFHAKPYRRLYRIPAIWSLLPYSFQLLCSKWTRHFVEIFLHTFSYLVSDPNFERVVTFERCEDIYENGRNCGNSILFRMSMEIFKYSTRWKIASDVEVCQ